MNVDDFMGIMGDPKVRRYVADFAKSNIQDAAEQKAFLRDVWYEVGLIQDASPSLHAIAEIAWRQMIKRNPILAKVADGWTQKEIASKCGVHQSTISRKIKRLRNA